MRQTGDPNALLLAAVCFPEPIAAIALQNKRVLYDILFRSTRVRFANIRRSTAERRLAYPLAVGPG